MPCPVQGRTPPGVRRIPSVPGGIRRRQLIDSFRPRSAVGRFTGTPFRKGAKTLGTPPWEGSKTPGQAPSHPSEGVR